MGTERWRKLNEIVADALELPRESRSQFIIDKIEGDEELQREAMALVSQDSAEFRFLDRGLAIPENAFRSLTPGESIKRALPRDPLSGTRRNGPGV